MNKNQKAFLDMIAFSEGTSELGDNGYNVLFGGSLFTSYTDHPNIRTYEKRDEFIKNGKKDFTTAAGRYQITFSTFKSLKKLLQLSDFSPDTQDQMALVLIKQRGAVKLIDNGMFDKAVKKCASIWASLPGGCGDQREEKIEKLLSVYLKKGGECNVVFN